MTGNTGLPLPVGGVSTTIGEEEEPSSEGVEGVCVVSAVSVVDIVDVGVGDEDEEAAAASLPTNEE